MKLILAVVLLSLSMAGCYTSAVVNGSHFGQIFVRSTPDECTIEIQGEITKATVIEFRQAINEVDARNCREKWVILSSGGGYVAPAMEIGRIIKAKGFNTQIHYGNACASACGMIFIAGNQRAFSSSLFLTRLGFHQMSKQNFNDKTCIADANDRASLSLQKYSAAMLPASSAKFFYDRVMSTSCSKIVYIGTDEAASEGISNAKKRPCNDCALLP